MSSYSVSGFLYNINTQQILLTQSEKNSEFASHWSLLKTEVKINQDPKEAFKKIIKKQLGLELEMTAIYPVYDYPDEESDNISYVFFAEVTESPILNKKMANELTWISFNETLKLLFLENNKQDVIVGERVIEYRKRIKQNIQPKVFS